MTRRQLFSAVLASLSAAGAALAGKLTPKDAADVSWSAATGTVTARYGVYRRDPFTTLYRPCSSAG